MKGKRYKGKRRKLAGAIVSVDDQIGKLIKALETNNLREKTLVIFSSDNGANGGEGGSSAPYTGGKGLGTQCSRHPGSTYFSALQCLQTMPSFVGPSKY